MITFGVNAGQLHQFPVVAHLQGEGDRTFVCGRREEFVGTRGQQRRLEGFSIINTNGKSLISFLAQTCSVKKNSKIKITIKKIRFQGIRIDYMAHLEAHGDTIWVNIDNSLEKIL